VSRARTILAWLMLMAVSVGTVLLGCSPAATPTPTSRPEPTKAAEQATQAPAAKATEAPQFDWQRNAGANVNLILVKHPLSESLIGMMPKFEELTGITVGYEILAEEEYFDKVPVALSAETGEYDVFMTGAQLTWPQGKAGWLEPLDGYLNDPTKTDLEAYDIDDFFLPLLKANRWTGETGTGVGEGTQWAIPVQVECFLTAYLADLFEKYGLEPPATLDDLYNAAVTLREGEGGDFYGIVEEGIRASAMVANCFLPCAASYCDTAMPDLDIVSGEFKCVYNQLGMVEAADLYTRMMREAGPPGWQSITWYDAKGLFTTGQYGMIVDSDFFAASYEDVETSSVAGKVKYAIPPAKPGRAPRTSVWTWALGLCAQSKSKDAAWYFIQWASSPDVMLVGTRDYKNFNPPRKSVWNHPDVVAMTAEWGMGTYREAVGETMDKYAEILQSPHAEGQYVGDRWAEALHAIYDGTPAQAALDEAAADVDEHLAAMNVVPD